MPAAHGTRTRYVQDKCRCEPCKEANRLYYHELQARKRAAAVALDAPARPGRKAHGRKGRSYRRMCPGVHGEACPKKSYLRKDSIGGICLACRQQLDRSELVSTSRVLDHLAGLSQMGVGYKAVAAAADVAPSTLGKIMSGARTRMTPEVERRVLEVDVDAMADRALVPSGPTREAIVELRRAGLKKVDIARALGARGPGLQIGKRAKVTLRTQHGVQKLLRQVLAEQQRHQRLRGDLCDLCGFDHGAQERLGMLERLDGVTWADAHAAYPCIYPDNALARRRFANDAMRLHRHRRGRSNSKQSMDVLVDELTEDDDVGRVEWTLWQQQADGSQVLLGQTPSGLKVRMHAKMDGSWLARAIRRGATPFAPIERPLILRGAVPGEQRSPGDDRLMAAALWDAVRALEDRGFNFDVERLPSITTHAEAQALQAAEQARQDAERAERARRRREAERREEEARERARAIPAEDYEAGAIAEFGLTENPWWAGYILADGRMLDFSGGQGFRTADHREVGGAHEDALGGTEGMRIFQQVTGAIRMGASRAGRDARGTSFGAVLWLDAERPISSSQAHRIAEVVDWIRPSHIELIRLGGEREEIETYRSGREVAGRARRWFAVRGDRT